MLGRGSFGKVLLVQNVLDNKLYAMKIIRKDIIAKKDQYIHVMLEKEILCKVQHPFLVQLYCSFQTKSKLYFVMEFINGGILGS